MFKLNIIKGHLQKTNLQYCVENITDTNTCKKKTLPNILNIPNVSRPRVELPVWKREPKAFSTTFTQGAGVVFVLG
ncbi:MAG: hypothetical protein A2W85_13325 [Bacteroidetes bacterium GWF2_41_31]|nr:MAG: hypothetical protein A2W85_13325 [Bacteroidetes bacterium GWF2_41_31]